MFRRTDCHFSLDPAVMEARSRSRDQRYAADTFFCSTDCHFSLDPAVMEARSRSRDMPQTPFFSAPTATSRSTLR